MNLFNRVESKVAPKIPHIIKYMGSKRNIIDFVVDAIDELYLGEDQYMYDMFAGSSIVCGSFRNLMNVSCNDIQNYSKIVGGVYLNNYNWDLLPSDVIEKFFDDVEDRVDEFKKVNKFESIDYNNFSSFEDVLKLELDQRNLREKLFNNNFDHLFAKYFSGTYWSYEQCVWIDAIASVIRKEKYSTKFLFDLVNGALMFSMAYCSQSTGHYAQYRDLKPDNFKDVLIYRRKELFPIFKKKVRTLKEYYNGENNHDLRHEFTSLDYRDALKNVRKRSIIYADPPYQFVHYSRFYHALETLVKYDYPELKYKGRYRTDRHQSPFCIKTQVPKAFKSLFEGANYSNSSIVLSYSNSGMITLEQILDIAKSELKGYLITTEEIDYKHSTMGRQGDKHRDVKEVLIIGSKM
ncbi:restriction endonuclease [Lewinellaceae bacterium SD302]|nr:restriction endonuclease [Lewinellaceae bacterium SD302]